MNRLFSLALMGARVVLLAFIVALIIRVLSFIPLSMAYEDVEWSDLYQIEFYSHIYNDTIPGFVGSALWVTLKLVLIAWALSIGLAIMFVFLKSRYERLSFLWDTVLTVSDIHVFGLFVIIQNITSFRVPYILLVVILTLGSGSLKEMVLSFHSVYKDVVRKEYWRFMYSQGIHPVRIGFAELLVRFTELSFTKLPILLIGSILVEAASNTLGLGYYLLDVLRSLENNRVDLNILTGISFTLILLVLLSQKIAEYVRVTFDPQLQL